MKHKIISIEILRIIACFLVIMFHCDFVIKPNFGYTIQGFGAYIIYHVSTLGLPVFFIVTSLSLGNENDYLLDLCGYYKRKIKNPGIPFFLMSIFYYLWNHFSELKNYNFLYIIWKAIRVSLKEPQHYHLWFIYSWLGLMILLPYLKRFLNSLSYNELRYFIILCMLIKVLNNYSLVLINEFYFASWVLYYILGYYLLKEQTIKKYKIYYFFGIISFIIGLLIDFMGYRNSILGNHLFDTSPIMIVQVMAIFCFFVKLSNYIDGFISIKIRKTILKLSKVTVWIYLWHPFFLTRYGHVLRISSNGLIEIMWLTSIIFLISMIASLFCEWFFQRIFYIFKNYKKG